MVWTILGVAGMCCLIAAALLAFGYAAALTVAGALLILAAVDGRRS